MTELGWPAPGSLTHGMRTPVGKVMDRMNSVANAKLKRLRAVEPLAKGCSYDEIARQVGFSHRGSAHRAVSRALAEREAEDIDNLRALECARLDALQTAHWPRALDGDVRAAAVVLRIMEQRSRLLGLPGSGTASRGRRPSSEHVRRRCGQLTGGNGCRLTLA